MESLSECNERINSCPLFCQLLAGFDFWVFLWKGRWALSWFYSFQCCVYLFQIKLSLSRPLFLLFSSFQYSLQQIVNLKFADDWIWTADLWFESDRSANWATTTAREFAFWSEDNIPSLPSSSLLFHFISQIFYRRVSNWNDSDESCLWSL